MCPEIRLLSHFERESKRLEECYGKSRRGLWKIRLVCHFPAEHFFSKRSGHLTNAQHQHISKTSTSRYIFQGVRRQ